MEQKLYSAGIAIYAKGIDYSCDLCTYTEKEIAQEHIQRYVDLYRTHKGVEEIPAIQKENFSFRIKRNIPGFSKGTLLTFYIRSFNAVGLLSPSVYNLNDYFRKNPKFKRAKKIIKKFDRSKWGICQDGYFIPLPN